MNYQFTSAAERVLQHAAEWIDAAESPELDSRALLLGLLSETECRAAHLLAEHGVSMQGVCEAWAVLPADLKSAKFESATPYRLEKDLNLAIREVYCFVLGFERSPILATEHLLLALLYTDSETTRWLFERGVDRHALEADIRTRNGYVDVPLDVEVESGEWRGESEEQREQGTGDRKQGTGEDTPSFVTLSPLPSPLSSLPSPLSTSFPTHTPRPTPHAPLLRLLDAAANRAREGLRVIEDYLRFVADDRFLTATAKQLRHDLAATLRSIPAADLLASRETQSDVGTGLTTAGESSRSDLADVLAANFGRLEESLRSLEEYGKLIDAAMAAQFKQIRYRIYTLERAAEITRHSSEALAAAKLYVLIDGRNSLDEFRAFASALISAGVHILQLRDKRLDDRQLLERARELRELTRGRPTLFIMNDRPDLAVLSRADGVHLGQEELTVKDARSIVGPRMLVGVSTHSLEQARQAVLDGANYIGVGPTFPSTTKEFSAFPGLELLRDVAAEIGLPAFAIGGITKENLTEALCTGIGRIAVSGAIATADNPAAVAKELLNCLV
jgi:thiamine-phosphate pyrophosphorylase